MQKNNKKSSNIRDIIIEHIKSNSKEYLIVSIIFLIGVIAGVFMINNASQEQELQITSYISTFINHLKQSSTINKFGLLKESILSNITLAVILWFVGLAVIGIPFVYGIILFRGFSLGYTISSIIAILGTGKGILFTLITVFSQNIILIPCILAIGVSGIKLYKSIVKSRQKDNIKFEIYRHTLFSLFALIFMCISSFIEVYISSNLLTAFINYI